MKSLKIKNLILIEETEIFFGPGLNILTGETGAGKSAILTAIRLIAGQRADAQWIRKGADFAVVEAVLEGSVFIRREIHRSGKNRCFIDDEQVTLTALKEKAHLEVVDQNSAHAVFHERREMLDAFAHLSSEVALYEVSYREERAKTAELETWLQVPKEKELEWAQKDLALLEEIDYQPGEEEKLAAEHHRLTHAQELIEKVGGASLALTEGAELFALKRILGLLESSAKLDANLSPLAQSMKNALLEFDEVGRSVQSYCETLEADPHRLAAVEKRMGAIASLKRRFGPEIEAQREKIVQTIDHLLHLEGKIAVLQEECKKLQEKNRRWAVEITEKRRRAALPFSQKVLQELQSLNLPHAQFAISVGENYGEIDFLFSANLGTFPLPVADCASGGELSRLLLAIQTLLSGENSCLIFDEIDSNVGGQTAAILGEKLQQLATQRQVICVTHFVQVAKCAMDHFLVSKVEKGGNAYTTIRKLDRKERDKEYERMLGMNP